MLATMSGCKSLGKLKGNRQTSEGQVAHADDVGMEGAT